MFTTAEEGSPAATDVVVVARATVGVDRAEADADAGCGAGEEVPEAEAEEGSSNKSVSEEIFARTAAAEEAADELEEVEDASSCPPFPSMEVVGAFGREPHFVLTRARERKFT